MFNLILMPAYGRRYETNSAAMEDWNAGKDFRFIGGGSYCSVRDIGRLARDNNNVILHTDQGGTYVIKSVPKWNPLDSVL